MRVVAAIVGVILIALMLSEFFVTFMLPRRVRRDPRIARGFLRALAAVAGSRGGYRQRLRTPSSGIR
jgi:hypothetical protein